MRRAYAITMLAALALFMAAACTGYQQQGAVAGGAIGGIAGAFLDHKNPWRGGLIGAGLGAIAGATIADISNRGSREVYETGGPAEYRTEDGRGRYYAEPEGYNARTRCKKVHERVWEDDRLVKDHIREICENIYEGGY